MSKKNLNWEVPKPLADAFDQLVTERWGAKGKWVGAAAAILMYMDAPEDLREQYGNLAVSSRGAKTLPEPIKAKIAKATKHFPE